MSYDAFTISAITIIIVLIVVVILIGKSKTATEMRMRELARNLLFMQSNKEALEICNKIRKKYPDICAGLDFTFKESGDGVEIDEWKIDKPRPDIKD